SSRSKKRCSACSCRSRPEGSRPTARHSTLGRSTLRRQRTIAAVIARTRMARDPREAVLFVCLGNICRSPTAEGVFRAACGQIGLADRILADSAGIGNWHIGSPPDRRAILAARRRGYDLTAIRGRQIVPADFTRFGWILAMDLSILRALEAMRPKAYDGPLGLLLDL